MKQYKANLHAHTTFSDGALSPEELANAYREKGYQVLAVTDHEFIANHTALSTDDFLILTGYELQIVDESVRPRKKDQRCCHLGLISKDPHEFSHVYFNPDSYDLNRLCQVPELIPSMKHVGFQPVEKEYSRDTIRMVVETAVNNNFLVSFNHPVWSLEDDYESYRYLDGVYAMEIYNNHSYLNAGLEEFNPGVYDRMLREGMHLGCTATDDTHAKEKTGSPHCDLFGGFTMILADDLSYGSIIAALEKGDFYASTGPEIKELYFDGDKLHVKTSDAARIALTTGGRRGKTALANPGEVINEASFTVHDDDHYIRITVKDAEGHAAFTRGYFLEEFLSAGQKKLI